MSDNEAVTLSTESLKKIVIDALEALKANDIVTIDVRDRASFTDVMFFASGNSSRHVGSIAESVIEAARHAGIPPIGVEGESVGEWILIDLGDVIVHVMQPETRAFYDLEKLWGEEMLNQSGPDSE
ncbi:MAG: ribosome silencing factor [Gammaproteobacteria bacterium]|nr:ribosome silencing factor [Gammaproteobacteria bacterium]